MQKTRNVLLLTIIADSFSETSSADNNNIFNNTVFSSSHTKKHYATTSTVHETVIQMNIHFTNLDELNIMKLHANASNKNKIMVISDPPWLIYINPRDSPEFLFPQQHKTDEDHHEKNHHDKSQRPQQLIYTSNNTTQSDAIHYIKCALWMKL